jgi:hypothetical protein
MIERDLVLAAIEEEEPYCFLGANVLSDLLRAVEFTFFYCGENGQMGISSPPHFCHKEN